MHARHDWTRWRGAALATLALLVSAAPASAADTGQDGYYPDAAVDREGTTHLVWSIRDQTSEKIEDLGYCRIPRGQTSCEANSVKTFAGCPTPEDSSSIEASPHVMITPFGEVVLQTYWLYDIEGNACGDTRFPSDYHHLNVIYTSEDDGQTFTGPKKLSLGHNTCQGCSTQSSHTQAILDSAENQVVIAEGRQSTTGFWVQGAPVDLPEGQITGSAALLDSAGGTGSVVQRARGNFVAAWTHSNGSGQEPEVRVATFACPQAEPGCARPGINDPSKWTVLPAIPSAHLPTLVSGPGGTYVFYVARCCGLPWAVRKVEGSTLGPARVLSGGSQGSYAESGDAAEDAATGRLHFSGFEVLPGDTGGVPESLAHRTSLDGETWSGPTRLAPQGGVSLDTRPRVAVATGDDGFTGVGVFSSAPNRPQNPAIHLVSLPTPPEQPPPPGGGGEPPPGGGGQPPPPGGGDPPQGGGDPAPPAAPGTCQLLQFGAVDVVAEACLERKGSVYTARGTLKLNGMGLVPDPSVSIRFDTRERSISSTGPVRLTVGDIPLFRGKIDWKLPGGNTVDLPSFDSSKLGGKLKGFPLTGSLSPKLTRGALELGVHVGLPKLFGGVTGDATLRADNVAGLRVRQLKVRVGNVLLGPLQLKDVTFDYDADADLWAGGGKLILPPKPPGAAFEARIGFRGGEFEYLRNELTFPGDGIPLDSTKLTHLTKIRFALEVNPLKLSGGVSFAAGKKIGEVRFAEVDGDLSFTFPSGKPAILRADGTLKLVTIPVATAYMQFKTDGQVHFGGRLDLKIATFGVGAKVDGWILPPDAFSVSGKAEVCLGDLGCNSGEVVFSSKGMAACAYTSIVDFGAGYEWGPSLLLAAAGTPFWLLDIDYMFSGCSVDDYRPANPPPIRKAQLATGNIEIGSGLPSAVFAVTGADAAPHVALVSPDGQRRIEPPADGPLNGADAIAFHVPEKKTTFFIVKNPQGGTWKVEPLPGSSRIESLGHAAGLPDPKVTARVGGRGHRRTLSYSVAPIPGQTVRFEERGGEAAGLIGHAQRATGTLRFSPANGPAGKRTIVAVVENRGNPRTEFDVATYKAPGPLRPARPKGLKLKRRGSRLMISWKPVRGISRYRLRVTLSDGRTLMLLPTAKQRTATVTAVGRKTKATVRLQGERGDGTTGAAVSARLKK